VGLFVLWLAFVNTVDGVEMLAGAGASLIAAVGAELVRSRRLTEYAPGAASARGLWRLPKLIVTDTLTVFGALWRDVVRGEEIRGAFRAVPFGGSGDDPASAGLRAISTLRISITPNTYVVDFDPEERLVLVHQMVPAKREDASKEVRRAL
jgi:multisubunit Na+/H+ antiporter MnhE subunit